MTLMAAKETGYGHYTYFSAVYIRFSLSTSISWKNCMDLIWNYPYWLWSVNLLCHTDDDAWILPL